MSDRDRLRAELADQLTFFAEIGITHLDLRQSAVRPDADSDRLDAETDRPSIAAQPPADDACLHQAYAEAAQMADRLDEMPAGASVVGALFAVFVILLVTDILGLTNVFPFTR